ncbi:MAG: kelch repeat-containing protein [Candidatus Limnocylindrales bacterium]
MAGLLVAVALAGCSSPTQTPPTASAPIRGLPTVPTRGFTPAGTMTYPRSGETATLLPDGLVLIVGGYDNGLPLASAELYDPETGIFSPTGSLTNARYYHSATLLPDGQVLIAGGVDGGNTAELFDPKRRAFSPTGSMATERVFQSSTLLPDGRVLVAGGAQDASVEIYDPESGGFTATGSMGTFRQSCTATLLPNGRVLIAGGEIPAQSMSEITFDSAELYDPATGTFSPTGSMASYRAWDTATLLLDGRVLVAGGRGGEASGGQNPQNSAELYDPKTGTFGPTGSMASDHDSGTATLLTDGRVLIAGGWGSSTAEIYDPRAGTFSKTGSMAYFRAWDTATLLPDGRVLIAGGEGGPAEGPLNSSTLSSAELYDPKTGTFSPAGPANTPRGASPTIHPAAGSPSQ